MSVEIVVDRHRGRICSALMRDGRMVDFTSLPEEGAGGDGALGQGIYLGIVRGIDKHLDAAFLDIGTGEPVFLAAKDARHAAGEAQRRTIARLVREGQRLVVQGLREAGGGKGPRVTTDIKLPGAFFVYQPHGREFAITRRLRGRERAGLEERLPGLRLLDAGLVRRVAAHASDEALEAEAGALEARWKAILEAADKRRGPGLLAQPARPLDHLLWQALEESPEIVVAGDEGILVQLRRTLEQLPEEACPELERVEGPASAFEQTGVMAEIDRAMARVVPLEQGGRIVIEPTLACVAIDVDGEGRPALDVDIEAAEEIALQVRLRNLGGTLIIDFIDLPTKPQRQRLEEALRRAFKGDPLPVQIYPMSPLGIVQISRARRGGPVFSSLIETCSACGGSGEVRAAR